MPDYTPPSDIELAEMRERHEKFPYSDAALCLAYIDWLKNALQVAKRSDRENEEQLVRISKHIGKDATKAPDSDPTIAGVVIAEIEWLKSELRLWKPMTPEEAEKEMAEVEAQPASEEEINAMLKRIFDPAERLNNREECQIRQKILSYRLLLKLKDDEIDRLKAKLAERERQLYLYGDHWPGCESRDQTNFTETDKTCNCDWEKVRSTLSPAEGETQ